ncbi:MerR family transcriptional regulator [Anaerovorax odorimutans]|uniref:MerR family transcriptional regulator n=1 Tax=Anaerovorax odorimutans TaxID=109327 RepID=A0ABT1RRX6_9FIRM|nr:MerR family transcriptional regulator [Anaerovorax odorimutans]MCQ4637915.1 MerR family transcriptional regulator [Anaerovorax odorimutans]
MEYTVKELADLAGISTRTLRYYHQIGLLPPARISQAGYRIYGEKEVDALQQILMQKAMGMGLSEIRESLSLPAEDKVRIMEEHLGKLLTKKKQIQKMIDNVSKTIKKEKGVITMTDQEKFEGLKRERIKIDEEKYGDESRQRYGADAVEGSREKLMKLSEEEYADMQSTEAEIRERLAAAVKGGMLPAGPEGRKIAGLHKQWLCYSWPAYSKKAHLGLAEMYTADERFKAYYDADVPGCAEFLREALKAHIENL